MRIEPPDSITPLPAPWRQLWRFESLDSTQRYGSALADSGVDPRGIALWAERQTEGHGRSGNTWYSDEGGIYVTAGLPYLTNLSQRHLGWLSLLGAMACVETLGESFGIRTLIKWPNDVLLDGRKVAGLLGETRMPAKAGPDRFQPAAQDGLIVLMGMGLNWLNNVSQASQLCRFEATNLGEVSAAVTIEEREPFLIPLAGPPGAMARGTDGPSR